MAGRPRKVKHDPLDEVMEQNLLLEAVDAVPELSPDEEDVVREVGDNDDAGRFGLLNDEDLYPDTEG